MSQKTIAVDFDGVVHKYSRGRDDGTCYDEPVEGAFEAIKKLRNKGYNVVIHTARPNHLDGEVGAWLLKHWPCDGDFGDVPEIITDHKPVAIAYIDDRAIRFTNWRDMLNYF